MEMKMQMAWLRQPDRSINEYSAPVIINVSPEEGSLPHYTSDSDWYVAPEVYTIEIPDLRGMTP